MSIEEMSDHELQEIIAGIIGSKAVLDSSLVKGAMELCDTEDVRSFVQKIQNVMPESTWTVIISGPALADLEARTYLIDGMKGYDDAESEIESLLDDGEKIAWLVETDDVDDVWADFVSGPEP